MFTLPQPASPPQSFLQADDSIGLEPAVAEPLFRRWTVDGVPLSPERELVKGLRGALQDAGLSSYTDTAEKWCLEMGAAFVSEVMDELDEFVDAIIGRDDLARDTHLEHLRTALLAHSQANNSQPTQSSRGYSSTSTSGDPQRQAAPLPLVVERSRLLYGGAQSIGPGVPGVPQLTRSGPPLVRRKTAPTCTEGNVGQDVAMSTTSSAAIQEDTPDENENAQPLDDAIRSKW